MDKFIPYPTLTEKLRTIEKTTTPLVLVGGCFDILHLGHIRFLAEAKKHGNVIVALESDESLTHHKGHLRPIHKQVERAEVLSSLETVDYIIPLPYFKTNEEYANFTHLVAPTVIAVTEGDLQLTNKQKQAESIGAKIVIVPKINTPSTTQLAKLLGLE